MAQVTLRYDVEKFPYGVPNVKVEVWGKELFDPRSNKTTWSNNGALVILDYYRSYLKVLDTDIDFCILFFMIISYYHMKQSELGSILRDRP